MKMKKSKKTEEWVIKQEDGVRYASLTFDKKSISSPWDYMVIVRNPKPAQLFNLATLTKEFPYNFSREDYISINSREGGVIADISSGRIQRDAVLSLRRYLSIDDEVSYRANAIFEAHFLTGKLVCLSGNSKRLKKYSVEEASKDGGLVEIFRKEAGTEGIFIILPRSILSSLPRSYRAAIRDIL